MGILKVHAHARRARTVRVEKRASQDAKRQRMSEDLERREAAFRSQTSEVDSARRHLQVFCPVLFPSSSWQGTVRPPAALWSACYPQQLHLSP